MGFCGGKGQPDEGEVGSEVKVGHAIPEQRWMQGVSKGGSERRCGRLRMVLVGRSVGFFPLNRSPFLPHCRVVGPCLDQSNSRQRIIAEGSS